MVRASFNQIIRCNVSCARVYPISSHSLCLAAVYHRRLVVGSQWRKAVVTRLFHYIQVDVTVERQKMIQVCYT